MALARLVLKHLQQRVCSFNSSVVPPRSGMVSSPLLHGRRRFSDGALEKDSGSVSEGKEVAVSDGGKKASKHLPGRRNRGRGGLWRNRDRDFVSEMFPSGLGNAIVQATESMSRLLDNLRLPNGGLAAGQLKESGECYKLRYEVPGLGKDDVKITVEDGVLQIRAEREEKGAEDDWSAQSYGYYNASLMLPEDAKADEIKAEMKDGVLLVNVPRAERQNKDVKEVRIQ